MFNPWNAKILTCGLYSAATQIAIQSLIRVPPKSLLMSIFHVLRCVVKNSGLPKRILLRPLLFNWPPNPSGFLWIPCSSELSPCTFQEASTYKPIAVYSNSNCDSLLKFHIWVTTREPVIANEQRCLHTYQKRAVR